MNWELKEYYDKYSPVNTDFYIARPTLKEIICFCDDNFTTFVGNGTIARNTNQSERTVSRHIKILEDMKIITTRRRGGNITAIRTVNIIEDMDKTRDRHEIDISKTQDRHLCDTNKTRD